MTPIRFLRPLALACALLAFAPVLTARAGVPSAPVVYAHRGGAGLAPENTLGAFRQTEATYGARGVWLEMDTQLSSDNVLVVIHDATLQRTSTNCTGNVNAMNAAALHGCDQRKLYPAWPAFEPIPTMRQVIDEARAGGWKLCIELKNIPGEANFDPTGLAAGDKLVEELQGFNPADIIVQSFFPTSLDVIERARPDIRTLLLTTSTLPGAPQNVGFTAGENAAFSKARGYEIVAPDDATPDLSAPVVSAIHALGLAVVVWTPDEPSRIRAVLDWGVDGIITNYPDRAYAALA